MAVKLTENLQVWEASADPGKPWCISGGDDGISINVYVDDNGGIQGVEVADGYRIVTGYGLVPYREEK